MRSDGQPGAHSASGIAAPESVVGAAVVGANAAVVGTAVVGTAVVGAVLGAVLGNCAATRAVERLHSMYFIACLERLHVRAPCQALVLHSRCDVRQNSLLRWLISNRSRTAARSIDKA